MIGNPLTHRFHEGCTYRLCSSPDFSNHLAGKVTIRTELKPLDQWGNRIVLADVTLDPPLKRDGETIHTLTGARCFIEEGYTTFRDSFGERRIPVEIAAIQGLYPYFGKAFALDEC